MLEETKKKVIDMKEIAFPNDILFNLEETEFLIKEIDRLQKLNMEQTVEITKLELQLENAMQLMPTIERLQEENDKHRDLIKDILNVQTCTVNEGKVINRYEEALIEVLDIINGSKMNKAGNE